SRFGPERTAMSISFRSLIVVAAMAAVAPRISAQGRGQPDPQLVQQRWAKEKELESLAVIDRKVMVPMRDGVRMATDVYRPKNAGGGGGGGRVPLALVRTPYNFN